MSWLNAFSIATISLDSRPSSFTVFIVVSVSALVMVLIAFFLFPGF